MLALAEELSEASAATNRLLNGKGTDDDLLEELTDVESVIWSLRATIGTAEQWQWARHRKEARLHAALMREAGKVVPVAK